jgi:hypothetical protein
VLLRLNMPEPDEFVAARKALAAGVNIKDIAHAGGQQGVAATRVGAHFGCLEHS